MIKPTSLHVIPKCRAREGIGLYSGGKAIARVEQDAHALLFRRHPEGSLAHSCTPAGRHDAVVYPLVGVGEQDLKAEAPEGMPALGEERSALLCRSRSGGHSHGWRIQARHDDQRRAVPECLYMVDICVSGTRSVSLHAVIEGAYTPEEGPTEDVGRCGGHCVKGKR